jgi:CheY-like chemotaxis protein
LAESQGWDGDHLALNFVSGDIMQRLGFSEPMNEPILEPIIEPMLEPLVQQDPTVIQTGYPLEDTARSGFTGSDALGLTETILYVEDETFVRKVTCEILRSAGYRVFTARTAAEAVGIYQEEDFDINLLLADVILPGETGRALAVRLRRSNPRVKVLLVSGYGDQFVPREGMREPYLAKPFSSEALLQRVRKVLDEEES